MRGWARSGTKRHQTPSKGPGRAHARDHPTATRPPADRASNGCGEICTMNQGRAANCGLSKPPEGKGTPRRARRKHERGRLPAPQGSLRASASSGSRSHYVRPLTGLDCSLKSATRLLD